MELECTCGEVLDIPASLAGQEVECSACGRVFRAAPRGAGRAGGAFREGAGRAVSGLRRGISEVDRGIKGAMGSGGDELSTGEAIMIFVGNLCLWCIPGLVLYFVWRDGRPGRASQVVTLTWIPLAILIFVWFVAAATGLLRGIFH